MSKTWKVYLHYNGPEVSRFITVDVPISDKKYEEALKEIEDNIPLEEGKALASIDFDAEMMLEPEDIVLFYDDPPERDNYESDEEYQEALEEYESEFESAYEEYSLENVWIDDPGDIKRFIDSFKDDAFEEYAGQKCSFTFEYYGEIMANYTIEVSFDDEGHLVNVDNIYGEAMECDGLKSSEFGDVYPNFDFIERELRNKLESEE